MHSIQQVWRHLGWWLELSSSSLMISQCLGWWLELLSWSSRWWYPDIWADGWSCRPRHWWYPQTCDWDDSIWLGEPLWNAITWYQLDATQWTTIGSHLEQVCSGSIHAENWHVLGIRGAGELEWLCDCIHGGLIPPPLYIWASQCLWGCSTLYLFLTNWHIMPNKQSVGLWRRLWTPMALHSMLTCTNFPINVTLSNTS